MSLFPKETAKQVGLASLECTRKVLVLNSILYSATIYVREYSCITDEVLDSIKETTELMKGEIIYFAARMYRNNLIELLQTMKGCKLSDTKIKSVEGNLVCIQKLFESKKEDNDTKEFGPEIELVQNEAIVRFAIKYLVTFGCMNDYVINIVIPRGFVNCDSIKNIKLSMKFIDTVFTLVRVADVLDYVKYDTICAKIPKDILKETVTWKNRIVHSG